MSSSFDYFGLLASFVFVYWQPASTGSRRWYEAGRQQLPGWSPPGYVFGVAWTLLYALVTTALFVYVAYSSASSALYHGTVITLLVHILLNKAWSVVFFDLGRPGPALAICLLLLGSAIALTVLFAVAGSLAWIAFGCFLPYDLWLCLAVYLNWQWVRLQLPTRDFTWKA